jgi:hypothetical protein
LPLDSQGGESGWNHGGLTPVPQGRGFLVERMNARLALWAIAPVIAGWREAKLAWHLREAPALKRWSPSCVLYGAAVLAGVALFVPGIAMGRGWLFPVGGYLCAFGVLKLGVRAFAPRAIIASEADFVALTSPETLTRVAIWVGLVWALVSQRWSSALAFGVAAALLAALGLIYGLMAHRFLPWRKQDEHQP